jgi:hypothetical protein
MSSTLEALNLVALVAVGAGEAGFSVLYACQCKFIQSQMEGGAASEKSYLTGAGSGAADAAAGAAGAS